MKKKNKTEAPGIPATPKRFQPHSPPAHPLAGNIDKNFSVICFGGSAGGLDPLLKIVGGFPPNLSAAVFIAIHTAANSPRSLPGILNNAGVFSSSYAVHGERVQAGRIYIAPPDNHLMLHDGVVRVVRGPKENGHRPAIDPLFRTAARAYGPRVIGVIVSGGQDCGAAGLMAIKSFGGVAI